MKKLLAIDLGSKTMGVAITDALHIAAHGYENFVFPNGNYNVALKRLLEIISKESIEEVAIGLPLNMNGTSSERSDLCIKFKDDLLKCLPQLQVSMIDERMTTVIATKRLLEADISRQKRKKVIDQQSAIVILESFMQQRRFKQ